VGDFQTAHWAIFVSTGRLEPQTAQWGVQVIQVGGSVVRIPNNVRNCGSGDVPNFLFQDTLYFGILLTSLGRWFKKQGAGEQEKLAFWWGGVSGTAHSAAGGGAEGIQHLVENSL
jgi:hypothetical protein